MNEQEIKAVYLGIMARSIREKVRISEDILRKKLEGTVVMIRPESGYDHTRSLKTRKHRLLNSVNLDKFLLYMEPIVNYLEGKRLRTISGTLTEEDKLSSYHDDAVARCIEVWDDLAKVVDLQADIKLNQGSIYSHQDIVGICYTIYTCFHMMGFSYKAAKGYADKVLKELGATVAPSMIDVYGKAMNHSVQMGGITRLMDIIRERIEDTFLQEFRKEVNVQRGGFTEQDIDNAYQ